MDMNSQQKEINEALNAGQRAINCLEKARDELDSASGFSLIDMIGADLIGGIGKHLKMRNAANFLNQAKVEVSNFQRELIDVQGHLNFQIAIGNFLTFADFLFDGFLTDIFVHSKIEDAKRQIDIALSHIRPIMSDLYRMSKEL